MSSINTRSSIKKVEKKPISQKLLKEIKENFDLFDVDFNNYLTDKDFKMALLSFGFELEKSEFKKLMDDYGNHGKINFEQFANIIQNKLVDKLYFYFYF